MQSSVRCLRGKSLHAARPWMGYSKKPLSASTVGGTPAVRPIFNHFQRMRAAAPLRAIGLNVSLPPVLYNRNDHLMQIDNALALSRIENQISVTLSQLAVGIRNADEFVELHLLNKDVRPTMHTLWFHEQGLRHRQHILSGLGSHHLVPLFSLISHDVERGKMQTHEAVELYEELMDSTVAHAKMVQREITNQMIRVHCLAGDTERAMEVVEEMKQRGIRRTFVTYAPLFRHFRASDDAAQHEALVRYIYRMEGGAVGKLVFIDIPRTLYSLGVAIRYNWAIIYCTFLILTSSAVYFWFNFRHMVELQ